MTTAADLSADDSEGFPIETPESDASQMTGKSNIDARAKISSLLKDREQEWTAVVEKKGPLQLLDLPLDVLKEIVKEVCSRHAGFSRVVLSSGRPTIMSFWDWRGGFGADSKTPASTA